MAFIRTDFSPVGGQGRAGGVPQVFAYVSTDPLATIKASGYFPITSINPKLNMLGVLKLHDWIMVTHDSEGTPGFTIIFVNNDGSNGAAITIRTVDIQAVV